MNVAWALRRASAMSARELCHRAGRELQARLEQLGVGRAQPPRMHAARSARAWIASAPTQLDVPSYVRAADGVLAGEFRIFALQPAVLGFPPRWNRDPKTGRDAPMTFGKTLDYRDEAVVGDIKYLWEPGRHAELVTLAQAWRLTRDDRYSEGCRVLLESWIDQCPYPLGPHWASSLELALRLVNWSFAWFLLGGEDAPLFRDERGRALKQRWLASIYQHSHFIAGHLSRYSSANNHLLGELLGMFTASLAWPYWRESSGWAQQAQAEFTQQALLQNGADGVNREQAVWYHHEVADMMLIAGLAARANGCDFSREYWRRLETMLEFLASIMDEGGVAPAIGDADDAIIARLDPTERPDVYASLLASGAVLFERADFAAKARRCDDKTRWLLGDEAAARFDELRRRRATPFVRRRFEQAGYYVLGGAFDTPDELRIVFDAGPLGYRSIAAHGHADALSFTLSAAGCELLIDPGTYAYHTQRIWRDYFRGTSAHNTLRIDRVDQSVSGGAFLWLRHAHTRVLEHSLNDACDRIVAEHDGYTRLSDPVVHRRELCADWRSYDVCVTDHVLCRAEHEVELFWHFSDRCDVRLAEGGVVAWRDDVGLALALPQGAQCELVRGSNEPPLGWRSHRFDERVPCFTVRAALKVHGDARLESRMKVLFKRAQRSTERSAEPAACMG